MLIKKGIPSLHEFGDYGNFATLIPLEIVQENFYDTTVIKYGYTDNSGRTIDLCTEPEQIDYNSFKGQA